MPRLPPGLTQPKRSQRRQSIFLNVNNRRARSSTQLLMTIVTGAILSSYFVYLYGSSILIMPIVIVAQLLEWLRVPPTHIGSGIYIIAETSSGLTNMFLGTLGFCTFLFFIDLASTVIQERRIQSLSAGDDTELNTAAAYIKVKSSGEKAKKKKKTKNRNRKASGNASADKEEKAQTVAKAEAKKGPKKVFVSVRILRMDSIDESSDTFDASILLFMVWVDEKATEHLDFDYELSPEEFENNKDAFKPQLTMPNMKEGREDFWSKLEDCRPKVLPNLVPQVIDKAHEKLLLHVIPVTGTFNEEFELLHFPFDLQQFQLVFRSKQESAKVELCSLAGTRFKSSISSFVQRTIPGFSVHYPRLIRELDTVSLNRPYSVLRLTVFAERKSGFFVITFYSLLVIIQLCTFMLFVGEYHVDNRFPNLLSLLLTITALKFVANEILPRISYTTMLDQFMFVGLGQIFLCCLESFILTALSESQVLEHLGSLDDSILQNNVTSSEAGFHGLTYKMIDSYFAACNLGLYVAFVMYYLDRVFVRWFENASLLQQNDLHWLGSGHDNTMNLFTAEQHACALEEVNKRFNYLPPEEVLAKVKKLRSNAAPTVQVKVKEDRGRQRCMMHYCGCDR